MGKMRRNPVTHLALLLGAGLVVAATPTSALAASAKMGTATGQAVPCAGLYTNGRAPAANLSVYRGSTLVRRASFPAGSTFRFSLAPGLYAISNQGHPGSSVGIMPFRIRSGQITHVVVRNVCK